MPLGSEYVFSRGQKPLELQRYQIFEDQLYQQEMGMKE
jgi:hypothetical protein